VLTVVLGCQRGEHARRLLLFRSVAIPRLLDELTNECAYAPFAGLGDVPCRDASRTTPHHRRA
jgi:hypothetical protein